MKALKNYFNQKKSSGHAAVAEPFYVRIKKNVPDADYRSANTFPAAGKQQ